MSYSEQFILIFFGILIVEIIWLSIVMKNFNHLDTLHDKSNLDKDKYKKYLNIVKNCYTIPKVTFIILAIVPSVLGLIIFSILGFDSNATLKIMMVLITVSLILGTLSHITSKTIFRKILQSLNNDITTKKGKLSITSAIMYQIIPVTLICMISSYFLVSSAELESKSSIYRKHYEDTIINQTSGGIHSITELINSLNSIVYLDDENNAYIRDIYFTNYRIKKDGSGVVIMYEPAIDKEGNDLTRNIYLIDPINKNIYLKESTGITKILPTAYEDFGDYVQIDSIPGKIYKIDNYAGNDYSELLSSNKSIDIFLYFEEEFVTYNLNGVSFEAMDSGSDFFFTYAKELAPKYNNRVYGYYGNETHGVVIPVEVNGESLSIIVQYDLSNKNAVNSLIYLLIIFGITSFIVYNCARSLRADIQLVSEGIKNLADGKPEDLNDSLVVTTNDEVGELVVGFNKVQELTKENIVEIKSNEQTLMEKERLASLGELIGGIAHNMKTPIMSTAGAAEGLVELITEYRASIDNPQVTSDDHKEIASDMLEWVTKIKSYNSYMSDIITAVKGQASQLASGETEKFTLYDLTKRVEILIKHEIKKANLILKTDIKCDPAITLNGDINGLIQVVNNLISNSIFAYQGEPEKEIVYTIDADNDNIIMTVSDEGCGMSKETQSKLFKQMYTTKGKNGTGLGLYMSYSTIRGKFNGNITFESEEGKGTTFTITIPRK